MLRGASGQGLGCRRAVSTGRSLRLARSKSAALLPAVRQRIEAEGAQVVGSSAADFERFVAQDVLRWRDVVRYAGAKPE